MEPRFGQLLTAMITPFNTDGSLDVAGARTLAAHLIDKGCDGLVVCGTTGESPTLKHDEKLALFEAVLEEVGDRASVIAGTGTYDTAESIELTKEVGAMGVSACLTVTPYYSRPPQNGLIAHFSAIADASPVPLMLYDIPGRTARRVELATLLRLAEHPNIVAVKDAIGDASETARVRVELDANGHADFEIYSGDDPLLLPHLAAGATGIVSVTAHLVASQMRQLFDAWGDGKVEEAKRIFFELHPLFTTIMTLTASPIPVKAATGMLGLPAGPPRLPLVEPTPDERAAIRSALEVAGLL